MYFHFLVSYYAVLVLTTLTRLLTVRNGSSYLGSRVARNRNRRRRRLRHWSGRRPHWGRGGTGPDLESSQAMRHTKFNVDCWPWNTKTRGGTKINSKDLMYLV